MGIIRRKHRGKFLPYWYGNWQVDGVRKWRRLCLWEGVAPERGKTRGDAAFERSRAQAERMFAEIRAGEEEAFAEIRQKVFRQLERVEGDAAGLGRLVALLAELTSKAARRLDGGTAAAAVAEGPPGESSPPDHDEGTLPGLDFKSPAL